MSEPILGISDDERFLDVAMAIADGRAIDWAAAFPADSTASDVIAGLQRLERVVRGHETIRSQSIPPSSPAHETVLTEARRKAGASMEPALSVRWGPLFVLDKIGRGSFGEVYRAWDPRLDREVALKLVAERTSHTVSSPVVEEGRLLARVRHPNVLTVHGAERIDGRVGIWTELVQGETLAQEIARRGPLSANDAARIGIEVCRALGAVHAAGLLHRDVKAQNILRESSGRIVLGDFGTGIEFDEHADVADAQTAGTPVYLAPEILNSRAATVASDLYSVGVLLYFLVTGSYPVRGRTLAEIRRAHATGERVPLSAAGFTLPERFVDLVEVLLRTEPSGRFQTAEAVELGLADSIRNRSPDVDSARSGRRWHPVTVATVMAVLAIATLGLVFSQRHTRAEVGGVAESRPSDATIVAEPLPSVVPTTAETVTPPAAATTRLTPGDWILVADFENQTGEAVLDGTLEAALKREFEYSEFVRVAQRDRWEDVLRALGRPLDTPLDLAVAREVCRRDGSIRRLITGRVQRTPSNYAVTLTIVDPEDGAGLATYTDVAPNLAQLLSAVREQALRLREALGEANASLASSRRELEHLPLPGVKALSFHAKALRQGSVRDPLTKDQQHKRWAGVEGLVRNALREDPTFAHAWIMLAWSLRNQDRPPEDYRQYARRAFDLAATATPQERYFIVGSFHSMNVFFDTNARITDNPNELEQALSAYEALFALQPDHYYVLSNLLQTYLVLHRDHEAALMRIRLAEARPANVLLNTAAAAELVNEGNLTAARRFAARAEAALSADAETQNAVEFSDTQFLRAYLSWHDEKPDESLAGANRLAAALERAPDALRPVLNLRPILLYLTLGRLKAARELAERQRVAEGPSPWVLALVLRESGDLDGLREYMTTRWTGDNPSNLTAAGARVEFLIPAGMLDEAEHEVERYKARIPAAALDTSFYPLVMGLLEQGRGHPREAVSFLQAWLSTSPQNIESNLAGQKLADARDALGDTANAIEALEKLVERPPRFVAGTMLDHSRWIVSHAQLARLYRKNGEEAKARVIEAHLRKLLAVADADHPFVMELKARQ